MKDTPTVTKTIQPIAHLPEGQLIDIGIDYAGRLLLLMLVDNLSSDDHLTKELPFNQQQNLRPMLRYN